MPCLSVTGSQDRQHFHWPTFNFLSILAFASSEESSTHNLSNILRHVRLVKASTAYGMEISVEKTKLMTNNTSGINAGIKVNGQKLETVISFKYLGSVITDDGS